MADIIKVLLIEDDKDQITSYKDSLDFFNEKNEIKIELEIKKSYEECKKMLDWNMFDAAIVDLKLNGTDVVKSGNNIIREIKDKLRYPIFVITGFPGDIDPDLNVQNVFFKIYERGVTKFIDVYLEIMNIYKTGVTKILGGRGIIENYLNQIFWKHLSNSLDNWIKYNNEKVLLRYIISHIQEYLDLNEYGKFEKYFTEEVYITPPIKPFIYTGTILENISTKKVYIVLSSPCDLSNEKAKQILLCEIENFEVKEFKSQIDKLSSKFETGMKPEAYSDIYKKKYDGKSSLKKILGNNYNLKHYFLPQTTIFNGGLINFQLITSYPKNTIETDFSKLICVSSSFCKDIISKFSIYYARQGSPDFDIDNLINEILERKGIVLDI